MLYNSLAGTLRVLPRLHEDVVGSPDFPAQRVANYKNGIRI